MHTLCDEVESVEKVDGKLIGVCYMHEEYDLVLIIETERYDMILSIMPGM